MDSSLPRLQPMTAGDLLDEAFALYRRNFALFAGVAAVLGVPQALIGLLLLILLHPDIQVPTAGAAFHLSQFTAFSPGVGIGGVVSFLFGILIEGAMAMAISQRYLGRPTTVLDAYRTVGVRTFVTLLAASIVYFSTLVVGLVLLIIPFFIFLVRFIFVPQAVVIERRGPFSAIGRSWEITSGSFWRIVGIGLLIYLVSRILTSVATLLFTQVAAILGLYAGIGTGAAAFVNILILPFELGALTLLYYDLRIRKEGFDLEYMAQTLDGTATSPLTPL